MPSYKTVRKTLADGTVRVYSYRRGKAEHRYLKDSVAELVVSFRQSLDWQAKSDATRRHYDIYLRDVERLANVPVRDVKRRDILDMRDAIASRSGPAAANYFAKVCSVLFKWALDRQLIEINPATGIRALPGGTLEAWTMNQAETALRHLSEPWRRVVLLAMFTGQRRGDLVAMRWSDYDGRFLTVTQQKTGVTLKLPVHPRLKAELDTWERINGYILTNARGAQWDPGRLSMRLPDQLERIGLPRGLNVHGLRKLAATRLAQAGCTPHEIAAFTGHKTLAMVAHYTRSVDQEMMAETALDKWGTN